jgi:hypothetical protein
LPGSPTLTFESSGTYLINFYVATNEGSQFTLFHNGTALPSSTFDCDTFDSVTGMTILTVAAGDTLTLRNHTSNTLSVPPGTVNLRIVPQTINAGVNAAITALKLTP